MLPHLAISVFAECF